MAETYDPGQGLETGDKQRKDDGKAKGFWLIPRRGLTALAEVFQIGADKYSPRGWEAGMAWSRVVDPMFRHILKWMPGEKYDPVDGQHHLASVAWACLALIEYEETHPELDDLKRPLAEPYRRDVPKFEDLIQDFPDPGQALRNEVCCGDHQCSGCS